VVWTHVATKDSRQPFLGILHKCTLCTTQCSKIIIYCTKINLIASDPLRLIPWHNSNQTMPALPASEPLRLIPWHNSNQTMPAPPASDPLRLIPWHNSTNNTSKGSPFHLITYNDYLCFSLCRLSYTILCELKVQFVLVIIKPLPICWGFALARVFSVVNLLKSVAVYVCQMCK